LINSSILENKQKVLVTGATGFIGINLVRRLSGPDFQVHILLRSGTNISKIKDILPKTITHEVDLKESTKLKRVVKEINPKFIFHLATAGIFPSSQKTPAKRIVETNVLGTINLITACEDIDYKCFINTGSSSEYGLKDYPMKETDTCEPVNLYGITKLASTLYAQMESLVKNKPILTLRLFSPYGPYDTTRRLIANVTIRALKNYPLTLASPNTTRDYVFIKDVLDAYTLCMSRGHKFAGEIFNIGSGKTHTTHSIVTKILKITNSKSKVLWNYLPVNSQEPKIWQADTSKSKKLLNWRPKNSLDSGLAKTIAWSRMNLNLL